MRRLIGKNSTELQQIIGELDLNAQTGEMARAIYRKGRASHSDELRDAKKVLFYAQAEVKRLEALQSAPATFGQQHTIEPAAEIDDESDRIQAIGQNGNSGEHYDAEKLERWKGAPEWANWTAQDANGDWWWYEVAPIPKVLSWDSASANSKSKIAKSTSKPKDFTATLESRPCAN